MTWRPNVEELRERNANLKVEASIVTWSRLEPLSLTRGDLTPGLQCLLGDPLWLLGRQWQFEEIRGEDAGSPISASLAGEQAPISRFFGGRLTDSAAQGSLDAPRIPIEVAVEAEIPVVMPLRIRASAGQRLLRMLQASEAPPAVADAIVRAYSFDPPDDKLPTTDPVGASRLRVLADRVPDADRVAAAVGPLGDGSVGALPQPIRSAAGQRGVLVRKILGSWLRWYHEYLARPIGSSWDPHRLEYAFGVQADLAAGPAVLTAGEYWGGTLDWHSFDVSDGNLGGTGPNEDTKRLDATVVPTQVRYPGMPADRLWQFEDGRVYLGDMRAGPTDLARLAVTEFSLAFGNDWYLIPVDLSYGSVVRIESLSVRDTFATETTIGPARQTATVRRGGQAAKPGWTVFNMATPSEAGPMADIFFLPATIRRPLEGPPLEEVALFRDEMANVVWGVERIIQGKTGDPVNRTKQVGSVIYNQRRPDDLDDAQIVYRLMSPVPENWIPFIAVPARDRPAGSLSTELERRPMVRFMPGASPDPIHPKGVLLKTSDDADVTTDRLRLAEEEVPRDGVVVLRRFQLARTEGGGSVLWVGRTKSTGQGEGDSGLRFDTALPPDTD